MRMCADFYLRTSAFIPNFDLNSSTPPTPQFRFSVHEPTCFALKNSYNRAQWHRKARRRKGCAETLARHERIFSHNHSDCAL